MDEGWGGWEWLSNTSSERIVLEEYIIPAASRELRECILRISGEIGLWIVDSFWVVLILARR